MCGVSVDPKAKWLGNRQKEVFSFVILDFPPCVLFCFCFCFCLTNFTEDYSFESRGHNSVVEPLLCICSTLGPIPYTT